MTGKFKAGDRVIVDPKNNFKYYSLNETTTYIVNYCTTYNKLTLQNEAGKILSYKYNAKNFILEGETVTTTEYNIGDAVRKDSSGYGSKPYSLSAGDNVYIIMDKKVNATSGNTLYQVDKAKLVDNTYVADTAYGFSYKSTWFSPNSFILKKKGNFVSLTKAVAVILDETGNIVGSVAEHDEACNILVDKDKIQAAIADKVADLLRKNPTKKYRVFEHTKTGSLPVLPVAWE